MRLRTAALLLSAATFAVSSFAQKPAPAPWVGTWATSPFDGDPWHSIPTLVDSTLREVIHTSLAGSALRVRLTNEFGKEPLHVDAATVARSSSGSSVDAATLHDLKFGG